MLLASLEGTTPGALRILFLQVHWIEEFYVYGNRVSQLPNEVCNLKKLRTLALNENLLSSLPGQNRPGVRWECAVFGVVSIRH